MPSSDVQCTALSNAIARQGCRFPSKPGVIIDLVTIFLRGFLCTDRDEGRHHREAHYR
jgi:hypothetical protein